MDRPAVDQRVVAGADATLRMVWTDGDGEAADPGSVIEAKVVDPDGAVVLDWTAADADPDSEGGFTVDLAAVADVTLLTVTWRRTDLHTAQRRTLVDVVASFWFSLQYARAVERDLADTDRWPTPTLQRLRLEVEDEAENYMDRSFVRRYARAALSGNGTNALLLPTSDLRAPGDPRPIVSVAVDGQAWDQSLVDELVVAEGSSSVLRPDGKLWPVGVSNVVVGWRYGEHAPPNDLRRAAVARLRSRATSDRSAIPDRARSWSTEMGTFQLDVEDVFKIGIPSIDGIYRSYSRRAIHGPPGAPDALNRPASGSMDFDPQRTSLFHGGRR